MPVDLFFAASVEPWLHERIAADPRFRVVAALADAEVAVTRTINIVDDAMIASAPRLRLIAQGTAGMDNIHLEAAARRGVAVIHLPGINANAVAELVIGSMIALTRTIPAYTHEMHAAVWNRADCTTRHEMRHYRLGIVGLGNVGSRVARLAHAFGMGVAAVDPYIDDSAFELESGRVTRIRSLRELIAASDILTMHVPLTAETRGMVAAAEIALLPRGAILMNAARGEVVDARAALAALADGRLGGLALDVYAEEPPHIGWPDDPRLIVTPHIGGCTAEAKSEAAEKLYQAIVAFVAS